MFDDDLKIKNQWPLMKTVIFWFFLFAILGAIVTWVKLGTLPLWLSFERKAFVASHQYVENKRAAIARYVSQCTPLPEGPQKQALRQRIATEIALIPEDARPYTGGC